MTPEDAVRQAEFTVLDDHRGIRTRTNAISISAGLDIRRALEDAASPRLSGVAGQVVWQLGALLAIIAVSAALGALLGRRSIRAEPIEEAAPVLLVASLVCIVLAFGQVWVRRRIYDRRDRSDTVLTIVAVFIGIAGVVFVLRVHLSEPGSTGTYYAIAAVAFGAVGAQLSAARFARNRWRLLAGENAPLRPRIAEPRPSARRIERIVRRRRKRVQALIAPIPAAERETLRAEVRRTLETLHRRGVLSDDDLTAAGHAELGMATIEMVADRARRGELELEPREAEPPRYDRPSPSSSDDR